MIAIRPATRADCPAIAELIMELATFEKSESHVKISATDLERDGFDTQSPYFKCLVAEAGGTLLVGYMVYYPTYGSWGGKALQLKDMYMRPEYRHRGIGSSFLQALARIAVDGGFKRITLEVFDWNEEARRFYEKWGAVNVTKTEERQVYKWSTEVLAEFAKHEDRVG